MSESPSLNHPEIYATLQKRDDALSNLIKIENSKSHYEGRTEKIRQKAAREQNVEMKQKLTRLAEHFDRKKEQVTKQQEHLQQTYEQAQKDLSAQLKEVKDPHEKYKLRKESQHRQADLHLQAAGVSPTDLARKNMRTTIVFMERKKLSQNDIQNFVRGSDFSQEVTIERHQAGSQFSQNLRLPDEKKKSKLDLEKHRLEQRGNFFSNPSEYGDRVGVAMEFREKRRFRSEKDLYSLSSKSKPIVDRFSKTNFEHTTRGGAKQFVFSRHDSKNHFRDITDDHKLKTHSARHEQRHPQTPEKNIAVQVNGNSLASNKPQHLYGIFRTDTQTGKTTLHKFGISGGRTRTGSQLPVAKQRKSLSPGRDYSNRGQKQVDSLNRQAQRRGQPVKYSTRILKRIPSQPSGQPTARQSITFQEKQAVTKYTAKSGRQPQGNTLPKPAPFSPIR